MHARLIRHVIMALLCFSATRGFSQPATSLPGTLPMNSQGDLSTQMVAGIDRYLMREIDRSVLRRAGWWARRFESPDAYADSVATNRERFRRIIGAIDPRVPSMGMELVSTTDQPSRVAETDRYTVDRVRWRVFENVHGEGLLLRPKGPARAAVIALPDADQTPEMLAGLAPGVAEEAQFARHLAANGCLVVVPVLVNRQDTWSGNPQLKRFTNQPHREWLYRQAYEMGRHVIGYEVQKVAAAVDWLATQTTGDAAERIPLKIGLAGYAEGGLIALYVAALETRVESVLVSGYFASREGVWQEPIYRNVFRLLREFGDAELATLVAPRRLVIEYAEAPTIDGPPAARPGRSGAAPGRWSTPAFFRVENEVERTRTLVGRLKWEPDFVHGNEGAAIGPGSAPALRSLLTGLGVEGEWTHSPPAPEIERGGAEHFAAMRQERQVRELQEFTQRLLRASERVRDQWFWEPAMGGAASNTPANSRFKEYFHEEIMGRIAEPKVPLKVRSRAWREHAAWTGHEVTIEVLPDVFAWGYLLVPKNLAQGERRPVVVCQHGLEGLPEHVVTEDPKVLEFGYYSGYASRLAQRGFIVFAPHNPYRGQDQFRVLQRKANPLGLSLFSFIVAQHERITEWLASLPSVDPERIGFYGLSYGGKTAMRVPALVDRYCVSICSADFNDWIRKNVTTDAGYSYLFTGEYEMPEFNLGPTFNYAEMAALIAPRPFMVERGHNDGVAPDEWVAYEYAKVRRCYARLGIAERTEIEFFNGPHKIHGEGTFEFLHKWLRWPGQ